MSQGHVCLQTWLTLLKQLTLLRRTTEGFNKPVIFQWTQSTCKGRVSIIIIPWDHWDDREVNWPRPNLNPVLWFLICRSQKKFISWGKNEGVPQLRSSWNWGPRTSCCNWIRGVRKLINDTIKRLRAQETCQEEEWDLRARNQWDSDQTLECSQQSTTFLKI